MMYDCRLISVWSKSNVKAFPALELFSGSVMNVVLCSVGVGAELGTFLSVSDSAAGFAVKACIIDEFGD